MHRDIKETNIVVREEQPGQPRQPRARRVPRLSNPALSSLPALVCCSHTRVCLFLHLGLSTSASRSASRASGPKAESMQERAEARPQRCAPLSRRSSAWASTSTCRQRCSPRGLSISGSQPRAPILASVSLYNLAAGVPLPSVRGGRRHVRLRGAALPRAQGGAAAPALGAALELPCRGALCVDGRRLLLRQVRHARPLAALAGCPLRAGEPLHEAGRGGEALHAAGPREARRMARRAAALGITCITRVLPDKRVWTLNTDSLVGHSWRAQCINGVYAEPRQRCARARVGHCVKMLYLSRVTKHTVSVTRAAHATRPAPTPPPPTRS